MHVIKSGKSKKLGKNSPWSNRMFCFVFFAEMYIYIFFWNLLHSRRILSQRRFINACEIHNNRITLLLRPRHSSIPWVQNFGTISLCCLSNSKINVYHHVKYRKFTKENRKRKKNINYIFWRLKKAVRKLKHLYFFPYMLFNKIVFYCEPKSHTLIYMIYLIVSA